MTRNDKEIVKAAVTLSQVIADLTGQPLKPKGREVVTVCPFHEDTSPSLRIDDEKGSYYCDPCADGGDVWKFVMRRQELAFSAAVDFLGERYGVTPETDVAQPGPQRREVATYDYTDTDRTVIGQVVRYEPKDFRQRRPDGNGGWVWRMNGLKLPLYRLHDLIGHATVYIGEGEKDSEGLWTAGLPATCNAGGAGKWQKRHARQLVASGVQNVAVLPHHDEPGRAHAATVAACCAAAGLTVTVVDLGLNAKGADVVDFLATRTAEDLVALQQATPVYEPSQAPKMRNTTFNLTSLRDLLAEPEEVVSWLVEDRIPSGGLALLAGKPKAGKSTMTRDLAFAVARGTDWLGWRTSPGAVWYLALEDKRSEVRRHFLQMGATGDESISVFTGRTTGSFLSELHAAAEAQRPALIIVDTMQRLIQARDLNDYAEVTRKLQPLLDLARETGAAVLLLHHAGKSERADLDSVLGSTALTGSVDTLLVLKRSDQYRTVATVQRVGSDVPQTVVALDEDSGRVSTGPTREVANRTTVQDAIIEFLRGAPGPVGEPGIVDAVEGQTAVKRRALRQLVANQKVIRQGGGKRNDQYLYSVSRSLVPTIYPERENEKLETAVSDRQDGTYSRSPTLASGGDSERPRERETDHVGNEKQPSGTRNEGSREQDTLAPTGTDSYRDF